MEEKDPSRGLRADLSIRGRLIATIALGCLLAFAFAATAPAKPVKRKPAPEANLRSLAYGSGATANRYLLWTPRSYYRRDRRHRIRKAPLLVMIHGCQTTAAEQMHANLYNRLAGRKRFIVAYPDVDQQGADAPGPLRQCWRWFDSGNLQRDSLEPSHVAGIVRQIFKRRKIDRQRVYLMGMSSGGFMTSIMAATYPDLFTAVGINAGGAYGDVACVGSNSPMTAEESAAMARAEMGPHARIVPRLVMGGDADQAIPPACADKAFDQGLRTNNLVLGTSQESPISLSAAGSRELPAGQPDGYPSTITNYRDPKGCLIGRRVLVHGMNHFWPGGTTNPAYANFTDPKGPNGAELSWDFFKRFTKKGTAMPCATR